MSAIAELSEAISDVPTALVIRRLDADPASERILDDLEAALALRGTRSTDARSYDLGASRDWVIAVTSAQAQLDSLAPDWHQRFDLSITV